MNILQPTLIVLLLLTGMGVALLGSVKIPLARRLNMDEGPHGRPSVPIRLRHGPNDSAGGFFDGPCWTASGADEWQRDLRRESRRRSVWLVAIKRPWRRSCFSTHGWALQINVGNVLTPAAFQGETGTPASAFNFANVFFGLGAFVTPLIVAYLVRVKSLSLTLFLFGGMSTLAGAACSCREVARRLVGHRTRLRRIALLLANPFLWLCAMALFFYMGLWKRRSEAGPRRTWSSKASMKNRRQAGCPVSG